VLVDHRLGYTTVAGLRFQDNATVDFRQDGSVEVDREGVRASDAGGTRYISKPHSLSLADNKLHMVMMRAEQGSIAAGPPAGKGRSDTPQAKAGPADVRVTKVVRARRVDTGDGKLLTPNFPNRDVALLLKVANLPVSIRNDSLALFRDSYVMVEGEKRTFNTLTVTSGSGTIWVALVIPTSARTLTLHLAGLPDRKVTLPQSVIGEAKFGR
jgi:hypothetical protein